VAKEITITGGRDATTAIIPGDICLAVGLPKRPPPPGWSWRLLSSIARLESGHTPSRKHPEYWGGDIPWIGIRDATGNHGRVIHETSEYTNALGIANSSARLLPKDTVCLSRTASVGYVIVMGHAMATSQDFVNWVCSDGLNPHFLKYALLSETRALRMFAVGSVHPTIYFPEVKAFHICAPSRPEQDRIADVLYSLDDKIELNRRMNETLEAMARAIFMDWFLRHSDGLSRSRVSDLITSGIMKIGDGYRAKNDEMGSPGLPFIRARELNNGFDTHGAEVLHERSVLAARDKLSEIGDVAFTSKGTIGRFARVAAQTPQFVYSP
jgi:restriction endonuclease S subunit